MLDIVSLPVQERIQKSIICKLGAITIIDAAIDVERELDVLNVEIMLPLRLVVNLKCLCERYWQKVNLMLHYGLKMQKLNRSVYND